MKDFSRRIVLAGHQFKLRLVWYSQDRGEQIQSEGDLIESLIKEILMEVYQALKLNSHSGKRTMI